MRRSIAWLRRDLRLTDNRVLAAATEASERVWPVFVFDPQILEIHSAAAGRVAWFAANVGALDGELWEHGAGLTATARLRAFVRTDLAGYDDDRDVPAVDSTSHLSAYLRVGAISIRAAWRAASNAEKRAHERRDRALGRMAPRAPWRDPPPIVDHGAARLRAGAVRSGRETGAQTGEGE